MTARVIKHEGMAWMNKKELREAIIQEDKERRLTEIIEEMTWAKPPKKNSFANNGGRYPGSLKVYNNGRKHKCPF
jgi:hypothetical protein